MSEKVDDKPHKFVSRERVSPSVDHVTVEPFTCSTGTPGHSWSMGVSEFTVYAICSCQRQDNNNFHIFLIHLLKMWPLPVLNNAKHVINIHDVADIVCHPFGTNRPTRNNNCLLHSGGARSTLTTGSINLLHTSNRLEGNQNVTNCVAVAKSLPGSEYFFPPPQHNSHCHYSLCLCAFWTPALGAIVSQILYEPLSRFLKTGFNFYLCKTKYSWQEYLSHIWGLQGESVLTSYLQIGQSQIKV